MSSDPGRWIWGPDETHHWNRMPDLSGIPLVGDIGSTATATPGGAAANAPGNDERPPAGNG